MAPIADEKSRKGTLALVAAWVLSVILAFVLGHQMGEGRRLPAAAPAAPATTAPATVEPAEPAQAVPTPDPEIERILLELPRRVDGDPLAKGNVDAKVVLTEWSDYRCPYCARWATQTYPELQQYVDDGTLRIEYRDLALFGEQSIATAVAGRAAAQQGRFWNYYETIFADFGTGEHPDHTTDQLVAYAGQAGVPDLEKFRADLADPALRQQVLDDSAQARQMGITGTPFFVINTHVINGAEPTGNFISAIERAAKG